MKFIVERNWVDVLGVIWWPAVTCGLRINLTRYDLEAIGEPTRENVEQWLTTHTHDFQMVADFHAVVGEVEIPWKSEEAEMQYADCFAECDA